MAKTKVWIKLTEYLNDITSKGGGKPKLLILTQDQLKTITGSKQKAPFYKDHPQKDLVDRAKEAGYKIEKIGGAKGDFIFW